MPTAMKIARIPITNAINGGDYTAQIELGPDKLVANVILDTGSSTVAVWRNTFGSTPTSSTPFVQFVGYGTGSWAGPVLQAQVGMGVGEQYIDLAQTTIAQIQSGEYNGRPQFYPADGILGLAYSVLNQAANVGPNFPLSQYDTPDAWEALSQSFQNITPWFKDLVDAQEVANKFAFLTKRSFVDYSTSNPATDPLNQGWFILGGGEEQTDLYTGGFQAVAVVADMYYNTQFLAIQVGDEPAIPVPDLDPGDVSDYGSNSIVDSGTNSIQLSSPVYDQMMQSFSNIDPSFFTLIQGPPPQLTTADLASWPSIFVTLQGIGGTDVTLEMTPNNYWQINATRGHRAYFNIGRGNPPQSILGLPLMNNYYVIFDRSAGASGQGEIKFAAQAT